MLWLIVLLFPLVHCYVSFHHNATLLKIHAPGITPYPGNITTPYLVWNDHVFYCRQCFVVGNRTWLIAQQPAPGSKYTVTKTVQSYYVLNETARIHLTYFPYMATSPRITISWFYDGKVNYSVTPAMFSDVPAVTRTGHLGIDRNPIFGCSPPVAKWYNATSCTIRRPQDFYVSNVTYGLEDFDLPRIPCLEVDPDPALIVAKAKEFCNTTDVFDCPPIDFVEPILPDLFKFCPAIDPPSTYHYYIYGILGFIIFLLLVSAPVAIAATRPQQNGYQRLLNQAPFKRR
ncbi:putative transmembrane protein [Serpentovirinae sp. isolate K48]|uniref:Transmembrane protein n=1 Tax=Serpentovirinae sp. isolate K48 TaxID=3071292 RepID=A0AAE6P076_9NIDO|nr:putative transmembrane protein [Serpentovirinae sp.]QFU19756.1 putative transmembrane protein [Serpentovirinae sp.]